MRLHAALTVFTRSVAVGSAVCSLAGHALMAAAFSYCRRTLLKSRGQTLLCFQKRCLYPLVGPLKSLPRVHPSANDGVWTTVEED